MFTENPNCLEIMSRLSNKRVEINSTHEAILKDNEEYANGIKTLSVQVSEGKDFLESEFPNKSYEGVNPYKALKEYYETIIKELNINKVKEDQFIDTTKEEALKTSRLETSLNQALEGYYIMVNI